MKVITAPDHYKRQEGDVCVFLAGGITKCENWQEIVIKEMKEISKEWDLENLIVFNPRRKAFNINDPDEAVRQIKWEHRYLTDCDVFSIYFCNSESDQPICMYELGNYSRMMLYKHKKNAWKHLAIGCESGYSRTLDVMLQSKLLLNDYIARKRQTPEDHALHIVDRYFDVLSERERNK